MGCSLSEHFELQIRAPRGSILSPALFNITINNNAQTILQELTLCNSLTILSYVSEARVERAMQLCVHSVQKWIMENGFAAFPCVVVWIGECVL